MRYLAGWGGRGVGAQVSEPASYGTFGINIDFSRSVQSGFFLRKKPLEGRRSTVISENALACFLYFSAIKRRKDGGRESQKADYVTERGLTATTVAGTKVFAPGAVG